METGLYSVILATASSSAAAAAAVDITKRMTIIMTLLNTESVRDIRERRASGDARRAVCVDSLRRLKVIAHRGRVNCWCAMGL